MDKRRRKIGASVSIAGRLAHKEGVYSNEPGTDIERIKPTKGLATTIADVLLCF